jgi:two-component system chemotaxis response regulator CheY
MNKLRALVIEDDDVMRNVLIQLLALMGLAEFKFTEARDGVEGLARFDTKSFDIVFVDWNMPKMSGIEFVRKVRASDKTRHVPIVMVTGETSMGKVEDALDSAGADVYITKPFTIDVLRRQLAKLLEQIAVDKSDSSGSHGGGLLRRWLGAAK